MIIPINSVLPKVTYIGMLLIHCVQALLWSDHCMYGLILMQCITMQISISMQHVSFCVLNTLQTECKTNAMILRTFASHANCRQMTLLFTQPKAIFISSASNNRI